MIGRLALDGLASGLAVLATIAIGLLGSCFGLVFALTRPKGTLARWVVLFRWMAGPLVCALAGIVMAACVGPDVYSDSYAWVFPAGGLSLWLGIEILMRKNLLGPKVRSHRRHASADDPRWFSPGAPQVAGRRCAFCSEVIRMEDDGTLCASCGEVCHVACVARHESNAHGPAPGPFRSDSR